MEDYRFVYLLIWLSCFVLSIGIIKRDLNRFKIEFLKYYQYLTSPWKVITFVVSGSFVSLAGRLTHDPTWDFISGFGMSVLTYLTAPWSIGVIFQAIKKQRRCNDLILAVVMWLLSASWFYDGYIWIRDGFYPATWFWNLVVSSVLYFCAGLFWNLEAQSGIVGFGFYRAHWPERSETIELQPLIKYLFLFMTIVAGILIFSTTWHL